MLLLTGGSVTHGDHGVAASAPQNRSFVSSSEVFPQGEFPAEGAAVRRGKGQAVTSEVGYYGRHFLTRASIRSLRCASSFSLSLR